MRAQFFVLISLIAVATAGGAVADSVHEAADHDTPAGHLYPGAAFDGERFYVFTATGYVPHGMEVRVYDPANSTYTTVLPKAHPDGLRNMGVASTPQGFFLFGGMTNAAVDSIHHYSPVENKLSLLDVRLPSSRTGTAVAYDGEYVWIFGGRDGSYRALDEILRFDPVTHELTKTAARIGSPAEGASAVWVESLQEVFVFAEGGISIFDPADQSVTVRQRGIPLLYSHDAVWTGETFYVLGARVCPSVPFLIVLTTRDCDWDRVLRYDPATDHLELMNGRLDEGRDGIPGIEAFWWNGSSHFVGHRHTGVRAYTLEPGRPVDLAATGTSEEPQLSWSPPPATSFDGEIEGYTIYTKRSDSSTWTTVATVHADRTSHAIPACPIAQQCDYGVAATNEHGTGPIASLRVLGTSLNPQL